MELIILKIGTVISPVIVGIIIHHYAQFKKKGKIIFNLLLLVIIASVIIYWKYKEKQDGVKPESPKVSSSPNKASPIQSASEPRLEKGIPELLEKSSNKTFKDCASCPKMISLPKYNLAISVYETTFAEYDIFAKETGRRQLSNDNGRSTHPVINVKWYDAVAYAAWLTATTGRKYRLPTEDEWENAARAGISREVLWDSQDEACNYANVYDDKSINLGSGHRHDCTDKYTNTAPVGSFPPNDFGIFDTIGNVWEWTSSCRVHTTAQECKEKVIRGGSWKSGRETPTTAATYELNFSSHQSLSPDAAYEDIGFRIVTDNY